MRIDSLIPDSTVTLLIQGEETEHVFLSREGEGEFRLAYFVPLHFSEGDTQRHMFRWSAWRYNGRWVGMGLHPIKLVSVNRIGGVEVES